MSDIDKKVVLLNSGPRSCVSAGRRVVKNRGRRLICFRGVSRRLQSQKTHTRAAINIMNVMPFLITALALAGCVTEPSTPSPSPTQPYSADLLGTIYDAVPHDWRIEADTAEEISPLAVSPELRQFLLLKVRREWDPRKRILALTEAILDPDGVGLTYDADATHTASEAFESGLANCMGFSNLLIAAARELGLRVHFELVLERPRWEFIDGVLVSTLHVRVVGLFSLVPGGIQTATTSATRMLKKQQSTGRGRRLVFDFYPLPVESGYSTQRLTDSDAAAHHLNNLAVSAMQNGNSARAYALLHKAIETSPRIAFVWSNLGILLSRHQLDQLSEAAYKEALFHSPDELNALSNLQRLYIRQGRDAEARELIDQLQELRDRNPYYHFWLGQQAYEQGNYEKAVDSFRHAIRMNKSEPSFYIELSKSYEKLGKKKAALQASRKAQAISSELNSE